MLMKKKLNIIKIGHIFQITHTEFNNRRFRIWKTNLLLNLIENQSAIDKMFLC